MKESYYTFLTLPLVPCQVDTERTCFQKSCSGGKKIKPGDLQNPNFVCMKLLSDRTHCQSYCYQRFLLLLLPLYPLDGLFKAEVEPGSGEASLPFHTCISFLMWCVSKHRPGSFICCQRQGELTQVPVGNNRSQRLCHTKALQVALVSQEEGRLAEPQTKNSVFPIFFACRIAL